MIKLNSAMPFYKVAWIDPNTLSPAFRQWVRDAPRVDTGPFVSEFDGLNYLCIESTEETDCPYDPEIQNELDEIKELVGYNKGASSPDYTWVVRIDFAELED